VTEVEDQARNDLRLEEYRVLKAEISALDARVERGISTILGINALVLAVIYLDVVPMPGAYQDRVDPDRLTSLELPLLYTLFFLNLALGVRYYAATVHIDKIGGYIARLEQEIYRKTTEPLGWEMSMRGDEPVDVKKNNTGVDTFRRTVFWVFVLAMNLVVLLDLTCTLPFKGLTECPVP